MEATSPTQRIDINFFNNWRLTVTIGQNMVGVLNDGDVHVTKFYSWKEVTLQYVLDDHFFSPMDKGISFYS